MKVPMTISIIALGIAVMNLLVLIAGDTHASDQFVQMLEARMQVSPGATKVLPECGCTIRYLGTAVHGTHYSVQLDRLD